MDEREIKPGQEEGPSVLAGGQVLRLQKYVRFRWHQDFYCVALCLRMCLHSSSLGRRKEFLVVIS